MKTKVIIGLCILFLLVGCKRDLDNSLSKLSEINDMTTKNTELKSKCEIASKNYDYWWEAPECQEYEEFHKEYEEWLIEQ